MTETGKAVIEICLLKCSIGVERALEATDLLVRPLVTLNFVNVLLNF